MNCETCGRDALYECVCPDVAECPMHGEVEVMETWSSVGFAGGLIYGEVWSCGCSDVDESADVAAAR